MLKQIQGSELKSIRAGQAIVSVCEPGDFPEWGMGGRNGVVLGYFEDRWGGKLEVKWDDGHKDTVLTLKDPKNAKGIGVYAYPSLAQAIV